MSACVRVPAGMRVFACVSACVRMMRLDGCVCVCVCVCVCAHGAHASACA